MYYYDEEESCEWRNFGTSPVSDAYLELVLPYKFNMMGMFLDSNIALDMNIYLYKRIVQNHT